MGELAEVSQLRERVDHLFALIGNPNVGKSTVFNRLTGMGVLTANYPGMTVGVNLGETEYAGERIGILDLPGTYALGAVSEDQVVARRGILEGKPEVVVVILDATNLARNLYLLLQVLDLEIPAVAALNLADEAERQGLHTDLEQLNELLGIPVIPTVATRGDGLDRLMRAALELAHSPGEFFPVPFYYATDIERHAREIAAEIGRSGLEVPHGIPARALAILLLERDEEFALMLRESDKSGGVLSLVERARDEIRRTHGNDAAVVIARERYGIAGSIVEAVQHRTERQRPSWGERLWEYTTDPRSGLLILAAVLAAVFFALFFLGDLLARAFSDLWEVLAAARLERMIYGLLGEGTLGVAVKWGLVDGIEAALSVAIPYVFTFYIILALLEDTGYLNSVAFLADRVMHRLGLHGRAVIPLISAAGCNVPAVMGTRVLSTRRERIIASTLIVLIPCSARTAVIIGGVSRYAGWGYALLLYLILFLLVAAVGVGLNRLLPGRSSGLVMEVFPFRRPSARTMLSKTWMRLKDFVFVATPIMLGGSFLLGLLYGSGWIFKLEAPLRPLMEGWLGLPAVAGLALIFAFLRKELALQLLLVLATGTATASLAGFMDHRQIFIFALVNAIYIPCAATFAVLLRELGWRTALAISAFTVLLALLMGGLVNLVS